MSSTVITFASIIEGNHIRATMQIVEVNGLRYGPMGCRMVISLDPPTNVSLNCSHPVSLPKVGFICIAMVNTQLLLQVQFVLTCVSPLSEWIRLVAVSVLGRCGCPDDTKS